MLIEIILSWAVTYALPAGTFEDDVPIPQVGHLSLSSLEGMYLYLAPLVSDFN